MKTANRRWNLSRLPQPILVAILGLLPGTAPTLLSAPGSVPGRILVKPAAGVDEGQLPGIFRQHNAVEEAKIAAINVHILKVPDAERDQVLEALQHNPNFEFAELDEIVAPDFVPNDPWYPNEWHLQKIQAPQAWDISKGSSNVIIAILDTGVDGTHPDLAPNLVPGWNFYDNNADTSDVAGHGTPVAGTAAAAGNNSIGVAAVAFNCRIMPLRVSDPTGYALNSTIASALTYAADHAARVANISYKVTDSSTVTSAAQYFQSKGGVTSVSAGNDGIFDTAKDNPYVLTVSATTADDILTSWSCTGNNVDLAAPGQGIMTTVRGGGYGNAAGTSVSAPIVAGAAALLISANPSLSAPQVQDLLKQTADDLGSSGWDTSYGYGRVNAYKALLAATGGSSTTPSDTAPPTANIIAPSNGSTLSGTVNVSVSASDNMGVAKVECYINGALAATSSSASASFSWNTTGFANGSYTLQAKAYDTAGNVGTSAPESVSVQNTVPDTTPPTATITAPAQGSTVSGVVSVSVSGTDNVGVTKVEWYLNGALAGTSASAAATFFWDTTTFPNGSCTLTARAYDGAGNVGTSTATSLTVQNTADTMAPSVQITSPTDGSTVVRTTKVYVTASDNVAVTRVDLLVDGKLFSSSTSAMPVFSWNTSKLSRGAHTLQAVAYDAAANSTRSTLVTVYK
jgi:subtilisin family serine protease